MEQQKTGSSETKSRIGQALIYCKSSLRLFISSICLFFVRIRYSTREIESFSIQILILVMSYLITQSIINSQPSGNSMFSIINDEVFSASFGASLAVTSIERIRDAFDKHNSNTLPLSQSSSYLHGLLLAITVITGVYLSILNYSSVSQKHSFASIVIITSLVCLFNLSALGWSHVLLQDYPVKNKTEKKASQDA